MSTPGGPGAPATEEPLVTVVGEALVDLVRAPSGDVRAHAGGSPANVAVGLARLGTPVSLLTRYGRDDFGRLVAAHLRGNGVTLLPGAETSTPTSVAEAVLDEAGVATYDFRITWDLADPGGVGIAAGSACVHTGSIAATLEPGASAVRGLMAAARGRVTVSYDPNCRPSLMGSPAEAREQVEALVRLSDVVKVSDEDLGWLYAERGHDDVAREWLAHGPAVVVVTRGGFGPWAVCASGEVARPAVAVEVADTVGAGDAFTAGLLNGLATRRLLGAGAAEQLRRLPVEELAGVLDEAALVSAITCSRPGADPPTAAEVAAFRAPSPG